MYVSFFVALVQESSILLPSKRLKAVPLGNAELLFHSIEVVAAPTRPGLPNWVYDCITRLVKGKCCGNQIVQMAARATHFRSDRASESDIPGLCNAFAGGSFNMRQRPGSHD
jgi:hypothetical protein